MSPRPERRDLGEGAYLQLWPGLIRDHEQRLAALVEELPLGTESYRMFGREMAAPRLVSFHGDPGTAYAYSGLVHEPSAWTPTLSALRADIEAATGLRFNAVLANLYRDGNDSMGWHADDEPEVGPIPDDRWIASVGLGERRRFVLKHRSSGERVVYEHGAGDLLTMRGTTQSFWRHQVPKTKRQVGPRLNLTFRHIVPR